MFATLVWKIELEAQLRPRGACLYGNNERTSRSVTCWRLVLTEGGGEVEAALSKLQGTQEIDHCGADFVRSFLLRPVAAALEHDGTAQLRYEAR